MLLFTERFDGATGDATPLAGVASLPFDLRQRSRLRVEVTGGPLAGHVAGFDLPRGSVLRNGDRVRCASGEVLQVDAAPESLAHIVAASAPALARIAYHLGNRHVPVEVGAGWLRLQADPVLEAMVAGLGAGLTHVEAPFEPEAGAYGHAGHGHAHGNADAHAHAHAHAHAGGPSHVHPHDGEPASEASHGHSHGADRRHAPRIHDLLADRQGR